MLYHKYDPNSKIYTESVELEQQPEDSVLGNLPEITEQYTVAFLNGEWVSVLKPELEIVDNKIQKKQEISE
jgi:hypothetical protein